jgi:hypothetical protein
MIEMVTKYRWITYPVKLGYEDKSGRDKFIITDAKDIPIIHGQGDCCEIGGIQDKRTALVIIEAMNKARIRYKLRVLEEVGYI